MMGYVKNAPLIEAWNTRVAALKAKIATLYDGTTTNVVIEQTESNVLLSPMSVDSVETTDGVTVLTVENPEVVSNEQAPTVLAPEPTLVEPEEGSEYENQDETVEETEEDTVDETVKEEEEETVEDTEE